MKIEITRPIAAVRPDQPYESFPPKTRASRGVRARAATAGRRYAAMGKRAGCERDFPLPSMAIASTQPERSTITVSDFIHEGLVTIYCERASSLRSISPDKQTTSPSGKNSGKTGRRHEGYVDGQGM